MRRLSKRWCNSLNLVPSGATEKRSFCHLEIASLNATREQKTWLRSQGWMEGIILLPVNQNDIKLSRASGGLFAEGLAFPWRAFS